MPGIVRRYRRKRQAEAQRGLSRPPRPATPRPPPSRSPAPSIQLSSCARGQPRRWSPGGKVAVAADRARQEAEAERRAGDEAGAAALDLRQQAAVDDAHVHHVEVGLHDRRSEVAQRLDRLGRALGRHAPGADLAAPPAAASASRTAPSPQRLDRRIVQLQEVDMVGAQAAPGCARPTPRSPPARSPAAGPTPRSRPWWRSRRRRACRRQRLADQRLAMAVAVGARGVEEGDAALERARERRQRRRDRRYRRRRSGSTVRPPMPQAPKPISETCRPVLPSGR